MYDLLWALSRKDKLVKKAIFMKENMSEEEFNNCQEAIIMDCVWNIEWKMTTFLQTAYETEIWFFEDKDLLKKVWKRCEKKIAGSDTYANSPKNEREFIKEFWPKVIELLEIVKKYKF